MKRIRAIKVEHELAWNGTEWWVTTYHDGLAQSGMPLSMFTRTYPRGYRT